MKKKLLALILLFCLAMSAFIFTACNQDEEMDATLYHLTLSYSSNVVSLEGFKQEDLKVTYCYGEHYYTEFPETPSQRDEDEIQALLQAGATQEDIDKAGVRQSDGSYYFFEMDPIYISAPKVEGYRLLGFFADTNHSAYPDYKPELTDIDGQQALPRWNMDNKNVHLEARYEKLTYSYYFDYMEDPAKDTNPNSQGTYCYIDEGVKTIEPATTTDTHKTFVCWEYQDTFSNTGTEADWIPLEKVGDKFKLPIDYYEDTMRIGAKWEYETYNITIDCKLKSGDDIDSSVAVQEILIIGNSTIVGGVRTPDTGTSINESSVIKAEYYFGGSWFWLLITQKQGYTITKFIINGVTEVDPMPFGGSIFFEEDPNKVTCSVDNLTSDCEIVIVVDITA